MRSYSWNIDTKPPINQVVLVAIKQPEELTAGCEPTPVWVGFWDGQVWSSAEGAEIHVTAWMNFPLPPFVVSTETVGTPGSLNGPQFRVGPLHISGIGKFHGVYCGEQLLAIRIDREDAQQLAQTLKEEVK